MGAATPPPLGGTPQRGWSQVGRRARRGDRVPQTVGRPMSTQWTPLVTITMGGTPATTSRRRRVEISSPCPGRGRGRRVPLAPPPTILFPS